MPALEVDRSITAEKVIDVLAELFRIRAFRSTSEATTPGVHRQGDSAWLSLAGVKTLYVEPAHPGKTVTPNRSTVACETS